MPQGSVYVMGGRGDDFLTAYKDMDKFRSLINIGFRDSSKRLFAGLFIPCPDIIANHNILNGFSTLIQQNHRSGCKAQFSRSRAHGNDHSTDFCYIREEILLRFVEFLIATHHAVAHEVIGCAAFYDLCRAVELLAPVKFTDRILHILLYSPVFHSENWGI